MARWVEEKREFLERDILQDFCRFCRNMQEQFVRYEASGSLSFSVLSSLIGDSMNKGLLWRLKDNAHLVLHEANTDRPSGHLLDWTLGYMYHELVKLMEDTHLKQTYISRLPGFAEYEQSEYAAILQDGLAFVGSQNRESMQHEVARLQDLMVLTRKLFCKYFSEMSGHRPLARFLYDKEDLVRSVFQEDHQALVLAVYGETPERLYTEAAYSLMDSARVEDAAKAVIAALTCNPESVSAQELRQRLEEAGQFIG